MLNIIIRLKILADFGDLTEENLLPGCVIGRTIRPSMRILVKSGTTNACSHCLQSGHNKAKWLTLKQRCKRCRLKGGNERTCTTFLDSFYDSSLDDNKAADKECERIQRSIMPVNVDKVVGQGRMKPITLYLMLLRLPETGQNIQASLKIQKSVHCQLTKKCGKPSLMLMVSAIKPIFLLIQSMLAISLMK